MTIDIRKDGSLIDGYIPGYYWCGGGCCSGDTPTPPGPEPPTPDTGTVISSITIVVADVITNSGKASAIFTPSSADTLFVYTSSDDDLAEIDRHTGEITVNANGFVTFCVTDLYSGLVDCKTVEVIKEEEPGPDTGDTGSTGITSITIIVADTITDSGFASAIFEPSYEETSFYYTSSDETYATINPITGEIIVIKDGVVEFCVEDLLTGLKDCKEVNVKKTVEPGPEPPDPPYTGFTGCTSETRIKAVYNVKTTTGNTYLYNSVTGYYVNGSFVTYKNWVTKVELEDGTDITSLITENYDYPSGSNKKCYKFSETGETTVYLTTNLSKLAFSFYHIPDLVEIEIPCNIDVIGTETLEACNDLRNVVIYSNDTQIIADLFTISQTAVTSFTFTGNVERRKLTNDEIKEAYGNYVDTGSNERFYTFEQMFLNAFAVEKINSPSATSDGKLLIADDGTLVAVAARGMVECVIPSGVTRIGSFAFAGCTTLERVTIPSTVESIGFGAFSGCTSLNNVVIPSNVLDVADYAFYGCTSLSNITLSEGTKNIGCECFYGCSSLSAITIPDSVTGFGIYMEKLYVAQTQKTKEPVFDNCTSLKTVVFGSGITSIEDRFSSASTLTSITSKATVAPILADVNAFAGIAGNNGTLYYPAGSDYSTWLSRLNTWTGQEINDI